MRVAVVTGCSSGVGRELVKSLTKLDGYHVIATLRGIGDGDKGVKELKEEVGEKFGSGVTLCRLDVGDEKSVAEAIAAIEGNEHVKAAGGAPHILVNNAGFAVPGCVEHTTMDSVRNMFDVNFFGPLQLMRAFAPAMRQRGEGRIINVSSVGGLMAMPFNDAYTAVKAAIDMLSQSMQLTFGTFSDKLRVVSVCPGAINTGFVARAQSEMSQAGGLKPDDPYMPLMASYMAKAKQRFEHGQTGAQVADIIVEQAILAEAPPPRILTSDFVKKEAGVRLVDVTGQKIMDHMRTNYI